MIRSQRGLFSTEVRLRTPQAAVATCLLSTPCRGFYTTTAGVNTNPSPRSHVDQHQQKTRQSTSAEAAAASKGKPISGSSAPLPDNRYASMVKQHEELNKRGEQSDGNMNMFGIWMSFVGFSMFLGFLTFAPELVPTLTSTEYTEYQPEGKVEGGAAPIVPHSMPTSQA
jgi:hypothetical protein